jgi:hypothetical protein
MSDEMFASITTVGILASLLLWVPAINLLQRLFKAHGRHTQKD